MVDKLAPSLRLLQLRPPLPRQTQTFWKLRKKYKIVSIETTISFYLRGGYNVFEIKSCMSQKCLKQEKEKETANKTNC